MRKPGNEEEIISEESFECDGCGFEWSLLNESETPGLCTVCFDEQEHLDYYDESTDPHCS